MVTDLAFGVADEALFDLAPVSLWLEDYSALRQLFDRWRAAGVRDLRSFLQQQPERVRECSAAYRVLRVNRRTLELFSAPDQQTLIARLARELSEDARRTFRQRFIVHDYETFPDDTHLTMLDVATGGVVSLWGCDAIREHLRKTFELTDFQRQYAEYAGRCCGLDVGLLFKPIAKALEERRLRKVREQIARELRALEPPRR